MRTGRLYKTLHPRSDYQKPENITEKLVTHSVFFLNLIYMIQHYIENNDEKCLIENCCKIKKGHHNLEPEICIHSSLSFIGNMSPVIICHYLIIVMLWSLVLSVLWSSSSFIFVITMCPCVQYFTIYFVWIKNCKKWYTLTWRWPFYNDIISS